MIADYSQLECTTSLVVSSVVWRQPIDNFWHTVSSKHQKTEIQRAYTFSTNHNQFLNFFKRLYPKILINHQFYYWKPFHFSMSQWVFSWILDEIHVFVFSNLHWSIWFFETHRPQEESHLPDHSLWQFMFHLCGEEASSVLCQLWGELQESKSWRIIFTHTIHGTYGIFTYMNGCL